MGPSSPSDIPSRSSERKIVTEAGEWLQQATLAIRAHIPLDVLADTIQHSRRFSEIYVGALKALRSEIAAASKARPPMAS